MELCAWPFPPVYTQSHIDYVAEVVLQVFGRREALRGLRMTYEPPFLRHFTGALRRGVRAAACAEVEGRGSRAAADLTRLRA